MTVVCFTTKCVEFRNLSNTGGNAVHDWLHRVDWGARCGFITRKLVASAAHSRRCVVDYGSSHGAKTFPFLRVSRFSFSSPVMLRCSQLELELMLATCTAYTQDCVTTMCVVVPITLTVCKMIDTTDEATKAIIISMALFGNVGGAATLIGDPPVRTCICYSTASTRPSPPPPLLTTYKLLYIQTQYAQNIVLGATVPGLRFIDFIIYQAPGVILATIPFIAYLYVAIGRKLPTRSDVDLHELRDNSAVHNPGRLYRVAFIVGIALLSMFLVPVHAQVGEGEGSQTSSSPPFFVSLTTHTVCRAGKASPLA